MINIDLTTLTDQEIIDLRSSVQREEQRRYQLSQTNERHLEMAREFTRATGRKPGTEWVEPRAPFQSYLEGDTVSHGGKMWESVTNLNMAPPGEEGWVESDFTDTEEPQSTILPESGQPWVPGVEYPQGHLVRFNGKFYEASHDLVLNNPEDYPAGWVEISEQP